MIFSNRSKSLYNLKKVAKKTDKTKEEVEFEMQKSELTFAPKLFKRNSSLYFTNSKNEIINKKEMGKILDRMNRARRVSSNINIGT